MAIEVRGLTAEDAELYAGEWVAIKDGKVLAHSKLADDVIDWLERHPKGAADLVFYVPTEDEPDTWML